MTTTKIYRSISDYEAVPDMDAVKAHFADAWSKLFLGQYLRGTPEFKELTRISLTPKIGEVVLSAVRSAITIQITGRGDRDTYQVLIKLDPRRVQDSLQGRLDNKVALGCRKPAGDGTAALAWLDDLLKLNRRIGVECSMKYGPREVCRVGSRELSGRPSWIEKQIIDSLNAMKYQESWTHVDWRP